MEIQVSVFEYSVFTTCAVGQRTCPHVHRREHTKLASYHVHSYYTATTLYMVQKGYLCCIGHAMLCVLHTQAVDTLLETFGLVGIMLCYMCTPSTCLITSLLISLSCLSLIIHVHALGLQR